MPLLSTRMRPSGDIATSTRAATALTILPSGRGLGRGGPTRRSRRMDLVRERPNSLGPRVAAGHRKHEGGIAATDDTKHEPAAPADVGLRERLDDLAVEATRDPPHVAARARRTRKRHRHEQPW